MGYDVDTELLFAWCVVLATLGVALWIRFFPTREDLRELEPIVRVFAPPVRAVVRWLSALGDHALAYSNPFWSTYRERSSTSIAREAPGAPGAGISERTAALGRIHRMNGEGGGLSLPETDARSGALSEQDTAGSVSLSVPGPRE